MGFADLKAFFRNFFPSKEPPVIDTLIRPSSLSAVGFDTTIFNKLHHQIEAGNYGLIHSLLFVHDSKLVVENYYNGWDKNKIHDIQSATKSIASTLIGIAIDKGHIRSVNEKLPALLPTYSFNDDDSFKKSITLKDLLTMSAGISWNEQQARYNEEGNSLTDMYALNKNWTDHILSLPMSERPGTKFNYSSGASILLGAILQSRTQMPVTKFAEKYLFEPLGIRGYQWAEYFGLAHCGGGLYLQSIDMARIGNLYCNQGKLNGKTIISSQWINESFKPRFGAGNKTYYGYQWWMIGSVFDFEPIPFAAGNGWQFIFVIPEFKSVIVVTGHNYVEQELKTTLSQNELIYSLLSCDPSFRKKIEHNYRKDKNIQNRNFYEILVMAQALNSMGEYAKTIVYLQHVESKYKDDLRFCFMIGEALFKTGNAQRSKTYLENCIRLCDEKKFPQPGYCQMAKNILALIEQG